MNQPQFSKARLDKLHQLAAGEQGLCVISCLSAAGAPHISVINAGVMAHPLSGDTSVCAVIRGDALKARLLRADPRVAVSFRRSWDWVGVRGTVQLIGPDDPADGFDDTALPQLLRDIFTAAGGTHDDWDTYDRVMAQERRTAVCITIDAILANPS